MHLIFSDFCHLVVEIILQSAKLDVADIFDDTLKVLEPLVFKVEPLFLVF